MGYMDSSAAQNHHHQEMCSQALDIMNPKSQPEKKPRPAEQAALHCPRCDSTNTKFCYYNNYSLSQPRYFCKSCRRYWTKGGTLRNVPVGGGCRKNKRSSPSTSSSSSRRVIHDHPITAPLPSLTTPDPGHDLSLAIATLQQNQRPPFADGHDLSTWGNTAAASEGGLGTSGGLFEALRSGFEEASSAFQNAYGGMENNGGLGFSGSQEMGQIEGLMMGGGTTASTAVTTVKQEGDQSRALWGFPWQNIMGDEFDSAGKINWQGLLNSPLI